MVQREDWQGLRSVFKIESEVHKEEKITKEKRYYISSWGVDASSLLKIAR
jgi:hypothetical protein